MHQKEMACGESNGHVVDDVIAGPLAAWQRLRHTSAFSIYYYKLIIEANVMCRTVRKH